MIKELRIHNVIQVFDVRHNVNIWDSLKPSTQATSFDHYYDI